MKIIHLSPREDHFNTQRNLMISQMTRQASFQTSLKKRSTIIDLITIVIIVESHDIMQKIITRNDEKLNRDNLSFQGIKAL